MSDLKFKTPKTWAEIKKLFFVQSAYRDSDGYWVEFQDGVVHSESGLSHIHEDTVSELIMRINEGVEVE